MATVEYNSDTTTPLAFCGFALLLSVPFHILLIIILVRYRKSSDFAFPFFHMLLSLSINDLLTSIVLGSGILTLFVPRAVHIAFIAPWLGVMNEGILGAGLIGDSVILVAIGLNRLVAYIFPLKTIWCPIHTKCAIIFQWIYAVSFGLTSVHPDMQTIYSVNESTGHLMATSAESSMYHIKSYVDVFTNLIAGLTLAIVYSVCVGNLMYHKIATNTGQQGSTNLALEARLSFQGFFLSCFLLFSSFLYGYAVLKNFAVSATFLGLFFVVGLSNFVFGPVIVIGMSKVVRKHVRKLFKLDDNVIHVLPTANMQPNEQQVSKL